MRLPSSPNIQVIFVFPVLHHWQGRLPAFTYACWCKLKGLRKLAQYKRKYVIAHKMNYLVQSPFGVSQEGNAVSLLDTDSHSSETGS